MLDTSWSCDGANGVLSSTSVRESEILGVLKNALYPTGYGDITNFHGDKRFPVHHTDTGFLGRSPRQVEHRD